MSIFINIGWWIIPAIVTVVMSVGDWFYIAQSGEYEPMRNWMRSSVIFGAWLVYFMFLYFGGPEWVSECCKGI